MRASIGQLHCLYILLYIRVCSNDAVRDTIDNNKNMRAAFQAYIMYAAEQSRIDTDLGVVRTNFQLYNIKGLSKISSGDHPERLQQGMDVPILFASQCFYGRAITLGHKCIRW
jgi:hypothetical protein